MPSEALAHMGNSVIYFKSKVVSKSHLDLTRFGRICCLMTKISNTVLIRFGGLKTSFRPFDDFNEMTIPRDWFTFGSLYLPFLIAPVHPFKILYS